LIAASYTSIQKVDTSSIGFALEINSSGKSFGFSSEMGKIRPSKSGDIKGTAR
jgi:hypothetical protein